MQPSGIPNAGTTAFSIFFAGYMLACLVWCIVFPAAIAFGRTFMTPASLRWANLGCGFALFGFGVMTLKGAVGLLSH